jgi:integrase
MSTRRSTTPNLCLHRATGQAFVRLNGKPRYLGKYGTPKAQRAYAQLLKQLAEQAERQEEEQEQDAFIPPKADDLTICELLAAYWPHAENHYRKHGQATRTLDNIRLALKPLNERHGDLPVRQFGPLLLKAHRERMLNQKTPTGETPTRGVINERVRIIRQVFEWGVSEELVPETVYRALMTVAGLQKGRSRAREPMPVGSIADEVIDTTIAKLPKIVADMVRFQRLTGCRPSEVCTIRPCDVERFDRPPPLFAAQVAAPLKPLDVWEYRPARHKTEHHGRQRVILIGPRAQEILAPYLLRPDDAFCFSPAESEALQRQQKHAARKTPLSCGDRPGSKTKGRAFRACYSKDTYAQAIVRACDLAFPPPEEMTDEKTIRAWRKAHHWRPNRLRHTAATAIRRVTGSIEKAQHVLGHAKPNTTLIYAERSLAEAAEVMRMLG